MNIYTGLKGVAGPPPCVQLVTCYNMERVGQLAAVCALHPGLGKVYTALLQQTRNTAEFYVASEPSLAGAWRCATLYPNENKPDR